MNKKKKKGKVIVSRIPEDWHRELSVISEEECRTLNSLANQAIKQFLERRRGEK